MKRASKDEVRAAAEALLSPLVEELRAEQESVKGQLTGYREAYTDAVHTLEVLSKKRDQEQIQLRKERARVQAEWTALAADVNARLVKQESSQEAFTREMGGMVRAATKTAEKAAGAATQATEDSRTAVSAATKVKTHHRDIQATLKSVRAANAKGQAELQTLTAGGRAQIQKTIKDQEERLEAYSRRISEQGDVLLDDVQKLLLKANAMAASQLQAEERIRQEFDNFKDTVIGFVSKTLGK